MLSPEVQKADESWAVRVSELSKEYRLGEYIGFRSVVDRVRRRPPPPRFEALKQVDFTIRRGECFGLVGGNGSGKSTLLQILSGVTLPTAGYMDVRGRVLPLLAIGAGFHPEFTGRQNIELTGSILGLSRNDVRSQIDAIVEFSELQRHIDTPTKRFSTGMLARLSFAIAVLFPADIYLFDEVLAVVDGEFRDRCLTVIRRLADHGRTVVFVSHDRQQVEFLCDRVIWMQQGRARAIGAPTDVLEDYERRSTRHG